MKKIIGALITIIAILIACAKDENAVVAPPSTSVPTSPVVFNMDSVPYTTLSTYHFYSGNMADLDPVKGVLPYDVITPLFSDYAHKSRFVWMPNGVNAHYASDSAVLDFPDGAVLIKNFWYDHVQPDNVRRIIETRLLYKKNGQWEFADYVWNAAQTEATLDLNGSNTAVQWLDDNNVLKNVNYRIPSGAECLTCHQNSNMALPIGPKPQNINSTFAYPGGSMNQLAKWTQVGYLSGGYPANINTTVRWDDASQSLNDRVRAYVDMNCSHCHADNRYCSYRSMRFTWSESTDPAHLGVCMPPADPLLPVHTHIVKPGNIEKSLLYYRINSTAEAVRMPLLGRTVIHEEGRQLIQDWINSLTQVCN